MATKVVQQVGKVEKEMEAGVKGCYGGLCGGEKKPSNPEAATIASESQFPIKHIVRLYQLEKQ